MRIGNQNKTSGWHT